MGEEPSPVGAAYSAGKFSTQRRQGAKPQGIFALRPLRLGVFALILSLMIPLLTELDSFTLPFLQIGQSYGLRRLRPVPKRQRAGALQDASRHPGIFGQRASVLDCGGPPPLSHGVMNNRPTQNDFGPASVKGSVLNTPDSKPS